MNEFTHGILAVLVPGVIISFFTAYVTVKLSIKQFHSEKWWEEKAKAYSYIIEHLTYIQYYFGEWEARAIKIDSQGTVPVTVSNMDMGRLSKDYWQARKSLSKAAAAGAYIVSDDTAIALLELLEKIDRYYVQDTPSIFGIEDIGKGCESVKECIVKIRGYAKRDLATK